MSKLAFIFPGQGSQTVGMGKEITENFKSSKEIFDRASDALNFDIAEMVFESDDKTLMITENTQPAILTTSIACMQPLIEEGIMPDVTAGLSLGEYTSHVIAETMSFRDAVTVVRKRGKFMQEAVPLGVGGMAAILGLKKDLVIESCNEASDIGVVSSVNFNCPGQIVIAGEIEAVKKAVEICKKKRARKTVLLHVSAPFHSSLMKPAGEKLSQELDKIEFKKMKMPVVTNVTAEYITDYKEVKDLLIRQVSNPVLWEDSVRTMLKNGVDTFVEIGPGKTLCGFIKKITKDVRLFNVEDMESLNKTLKGLKK